MNITTQEIPEDTYYLKIKNFIKLLLRKKKKKKMRIGNAKLKHKTSRVYNSV